jgi:hypothetical protein
MPAAGWASQEEIAASASEVESGRSNIRGFSSNSQKGPQREPSEADEIGRREHSFEPDSAFLVLLGCRMASIEQQVRIVEDQR